MIGQRRSNDDDQRRADQLEDRAVAAVDLAYSQWMRVDVNAFARIRVLCADITLRADGRIAWTGEQPRPRTRRR